MELKLWHKNKIW